MERVVQTKRRSHREIPADMWSKIISIWPCHSLQPYCDPNAPYQKGSAERNHEFIREFVPKGADFGKYTQEDITLMMNHINSYGRESLADKCPFEVFRFLYGDELLQLMNFVTIPANDVTLDKSIWRKEVKPQC